MNTTKDERPGAVAGQVDCRVRPCEVPCGKCGHAGVYRRFVGQGERMESKEYNRSPSKYASGQCHGYSAYRDHLQNICQCCGYVWQTLPLAKKRKTTTGVGGAA